MRTISAFSRQDEKQSLFLFFSKFISCKEKAFYLILTGLQSASMWANEISLPVVSNWCDPIL
jgi:hypothetical protein